ncbi:PASTA domain-containing protein [Tessaracoccus sp. OS52]|uniref:protein kinase domain-containing protein n=1 Tax=Tessaracoccus sp. OS52 TaxID=2886691 RepID=UPI00272C802C|nr:PASTA domain-containing protein [Tessaracoccus sp. OS52]
MTEMEGGVVLDGRYRLRALLGTGSTGSVFAATDEHGSADVAVKLLHPHLCRDERKRRAFLREQRHLMGLEHPNIIAVHGAGIHDAAGVPTPWIAFELLAGPNLQEWVAEHRPTAADAVAITLGVLAGLGEAHRAGLVHRDLGPSNIVIQDRQGEAGPVGSRQVRIVDFGLAALDGEAAVGEDVLLSGDRPLVPSAEKGAHVVGNPSFMSPEQARGLPVTAASDLYQVGALLHFLLTGQAPFPRDTVGQTLQAHVDAPPPVPSALRPEQRAFDRIVTRAMAKDPTDRYPDAAAFAGALATVAAPVSRGTAATLVLPAVGSTRVLPLGTAPAPQADADLPVVPAPVPHWAGAALATALVPQTQRPAELAANVGVGAPAASAAPERASSSNRPAYLEPVAAAPTQARAPRSSGGALAAVMLVLVVAMAVGLGFLGQRPTPVPAAEPSVAASGVPTASPVAMPTGSSGAASATPTSAPTTTAPSTPPSPESTPSTALPSVTTVESSEPAGDPVVVPVLYGTISDAADVLEDAGLRVGEVVRTDSPEEADRVLSQYPRAGQVVQPGSPVDLTIASGSNAVPEVSGMTVAHASAYLQSSGFTVATEPAGADSRAVVASVVPAPGTVLRVGTTVTLVAATPSSSPTAQESSPQPADPVSSPSATQTVEPA